MTASTKWSEISASILLAVLSLLAANGCKRPSVSGPFAPARSGPVKDLASIRAGDQLTLTWTMPEKRATKLAVHGLVAVRVCWRESAAGPCTDASKTLHLAPGATGYFSDELPPALASGDARVIDYFVELLDRNDHSTGLSNRVSSLAGAPPPSVGGFTAAMTPAGILLHWTLAATDSYTVVQIHRVRVVLRSSDETDSTAPDPVPEGRDFEAGNGAAQLLDKDFKPGETYVYSARRVARFTVAKQTLELVSQPSDSVEVRAVPTAPRP
ncbi:MAG TPA: hypothetical protein VMU48_02215 [Terracidiphilus sp.]|nr:hypothetical protein [Terracidiphilus sp.]